jgi:hypothetical protein
LLQNGSGKPKYARMLFLRTCAWQKKKIYRLVILDVLLKYHLLQLDGCGENIT